MVTTSKIFGKGQITLPKEWRDKHKTNIVIIRETPQGLLIKPLQDEVYYEIDEENFGINFPSGISAKVLAEKLRKANAKISKNLK